MSTLRLSWLFFKVGVLNELQYRVNFVVQLFQSAIALTVGLVVLSLVYSHTNELNGWSQSELLCVLGIQILMGGAIKTYIQPNMTRLIDDVREGKLDCFWLVIATCAFWVVNMWHAVELFDGIFATGRFPVGIYPGWLRYSVTFLVPIAFAVTVPAEAVTSRLGWPTLVLAVVFALVLFSFTRWFWRYGLRSYTGASA